MCNATDNHNINDDKKDETEEETAVAPAAAAGDTLITAIVTKTSPNESVGIGMGSTQGGGTAITSIKKDSLAFAQAPDKLVVGAIIQEVNGIDCTSKDPTEIASLLADAQDKITIVVKTVPVPPVVEGGGVLKPQVMEDRGNDDGGKPQEPDEFAHLQKWENLANCCSRCCCCACMCACWVLTCRATGHVSAPGSPPFNPCNVKFWQRPTNEEPKWRLAEPPETFN